MNNEKCSDKRQQKMANGCDKIIKPKCKLTKSGWEKKATIIRGIKTSNTIIVKMKIA